jgi:hypothetical protein
VNLNSNYIQVNGTSNAQGTTNANINFNGGSIIFTSLSNSWKEQTGYGSRIEYANINLTGITITDASPKINNNSILGRIDVNGGAPIVSNNTLQTLSMSAPISVSTGSPIIVNNNISTLRFDAGNPDTAYGIDMKNPINAYISDNTMGHFRRAGINAVAGSAIIQRNHIPDGIEGGVQTIIQNNTMNGIINPSSASTIIYNNIGRSAIHLTTANDINATYNWWGTTDTQVINQSIYDFKNDFNLGVVNFVPFLTEPNPQAMPNPNAPPPTPTTPPSPTPTIPETNPVAVFLAVVAVTCFFAFVFRKKNLFSS